MTLCNSKLSSQYFHLLLKTYLVDVDPSSQCPSCPPTRTTYTCVTNVKKCFDFDSLFSEPLTIQNEGTVEEHALYTFQLSSGNYLMVTEHSYETAR